jgi:hypothetical protein
MKESNVGDGKRICNGVPHKSSIVSFKVIPSGKSKWIVGKTGRLIDKRNKKVRYKIMRYENGEGTLMLPNSYLNKRA